MLDYYLKYLNMQLRVLAALWCVGPVGGGAYKENVFDIIVIEVILFLLGPPVCLWLDQN